MDHFIGQENIILGGVAGGFLRLLISFPDVRPGMKLYIVDADTGVQTSLPLEQYATINMQEGTGNG